MHLKECYSIFGGDYDDVLKRFGSEKMVEKFMLKFIQDNSFSLLEDALEAKNTDDAFRAAHTIKGISQNLSFTALFKSANSVTEALRNSDFEKAIKLFPQLEADYILTVSTIRQYEM